MQKAKFEKHVRYQLIIARKYGAELRTVDILVL